MNIRLKEMVLITFLAVFISSCSSSDLQTRRLDQAEEQIIRAKEVANQPLVANEFIGTADAFLATVNDSKSILSEAEKARFEQLKKASKELSQSVNK